MKRLLVLAMFGMMLAVGAVPRESARTVLFPFREAVIAARADSLLLPYRFKLGEAFAEGAVLVTLDDSRYTIEAKRALEQFEFAHTTYEDKKQLREKNFTSDYELKKAAFDRQVAENDLAGAKLNLSYCTIRAPFAGKIVEIKTREYETVRPGQPLFRIIDDSRLLAVMNVPMNDAGLTTVGNSVTLSVSGREQNTTGTIYEVTPQADHRTGTIRIRVLIDNREGKFKAGMTGELIHEE